MEVTSQESDVAGKAPNIHTSSSTSDVAEADYKIPTSTEEETGKPCKNLDSDNNQDLEENQEGQREPMEEEQQENEKEEQSLLDEAKRSIAYPAAKKKKSQQDPLLPTATITPGTSTAHKVTTVSPMLAAEKRNIAYPKNRGTAAPTTEVPAVDTNAQQPIHKENQMMANTAKTDEPSALLVHEKQHIAYPKSGPSSKNRATGIQGLAEADHPLPTSATAARKVTTVSPMLAEEKQYIVYPKRHGSVSQTQVPPAAIFTEQTMDDTAKTDEPSALLAHEKRHIAYPKSGPAGKSRASNNQGDRSGTAEPALADSTNNSNQGWTSKPSTGNSTLLQAAKRTIKYPRGETNRTANTDEVRLVTVQHNDNRGITPLLPPEGSLTTENSEPPPSALQPGHDEPSVPSPEASHEETLFQESREVAETVAEAEIAQPPTFNHVDSNSGLAVANLVVADETTTQDLPQAQDYSPDEINNNREEKMKQFKTKVFLGVIVLLAITIILVAILITRRQEENADLVPTTSPSEMPSSNPSQGPSSYSEYWLSLFPESTVSAILEDPESPQSMAFEWLTEEIDILRNLTEQRVVQRFVLASFYFANSDDQWSYSDNWLNHSVHECLWYSGLEDFYFFFGADQLLPLDHISPCEQDPAGYLEGGILYQGDGIMRHLWLQFNGLVGSGIPPELYLLTELRSLGLDELNLTSTIPEELSGLPSLEYISMNFCSLYGSIPEALGSLSKLGIMYFGWNSLTGTLPSSLFSLTMQSVALPENQLTGPVPTELGLLTALGGLALDTNLFTGTLPTEIGRLTGLESLYLNSLILSGAIPNELAALTDMILLYLDNSGFSGTIPKWLDSMTSIDTLFLSDNSFTGTIPTELGLLTEMLVLWLNSNALSGTIPTEIGMYEQVSQLCGCDLCICSDNTTSQTLEGERLVYVDGQLLLLSDEGYLLPLSEANLTEGNQTEP
ncbi:Leucine Rich Repeat [Seminavis robusta]|uniref:Leucine Rich Repeat n=1 Tax=Seminavis robusta TaxID=568900 RepID=A0A9N8HLN6_9STRA|nr:Leucine Rich Repeat [Seminavis robusta]|eukprot:Sro837_g209100.1 Leucine Rich Repeat (957) ;mRNA; r:2995-6434